MRLEVEGNLPFVAIRVGEDTLHTIRGIGGSEVVFSRRVDYLQVGGRAVLDFGNLTIEFPGGKN